MIFVYSWTKAKIAEVSKAYVLVLRGELELIWEEHVAVQVSDMDMWRLIVVAWP